MVNTRPKPRLLTEAQLRIFVDAALSSQNGIFETKHAQKDHPERQLTRLDVWLGLCRPDWVLAGHRFNREHWTHRYKIKTVGITGKALNIVIAVTKKGKIRVITRHGKT